MKSIVFAADLFATDPASTFPAIHHDDPQVMTLARILCNTDGGNWERELSGTQQSAYYAEPYHYTIAGHIKQAIAMLAALREEGWIA